MLRIRLVCRFGVWTIGMVGKIKRAYMMSRVERAQLYREEVERLIRFENAERDGVGLCPYDNKPCDNVERGCEDTFIGEAAANGVGELIWRCPRLKGKKADLIIK